jgi:hypothetical protein
MHRTQFQKRKKKNPTEKFSLSFSRTAKLFTNCKFCMIFVALIPVMNYYA